MGNFENFFFINDKEGDKKFLKPVKFEKMYELSFSVFGFALSNIELLSLMFE